MRVLSLKEPWASLIKEGYKKIETRSWKTNYRGTLYIHASKGKITKKDLFLNKEVINLLKNKDFYYGKIILKCELVDCVYMSEEFINEIKKDRYEYICGDYRVGRYAWVLKNIELIEPISATGQLGIWQLYLVILIS